MASLTTALITLVSLCAGMLLGSVIRERLPDHHLRDDSRDVIKTASGMIATLVALVVGLLVSSAKSSFDQANEGLVQAGAKFILLDRTLSRYGAEATPARRRLAELIADADEAAALRATARAYFAVQGIRRPDGFCAIHAPGV